jgi:hypothetical protein
MPAPALTLWCSYFWNVIAYELGAVMGDHLGAGDEWAAALTALCGG